MNFEQILQQKMQKNSHLNINSSSENSTFQVGTDPAHLAFLLGQIRRTHQPLISKKNSYKSTPLERKPHAFNELQEQAFHFLQSLIPDLTNAFSPRELKKAFRRAALIAHPDHGGNTESFLLLKIHYECLQAIA